MSKLEEQQPEKLEPWHTPAPWHVDMVVGLGGLVVRDAQCREIAHVRVLPVGIAREEQEANARRIIDCVNACAGIPTKALKGGVVGDLLYSIRLQFGALSKLEQE